MNETIRTYIEGFDDEVEGGIPKGHIVMIAGTPGTLKSSTAFNILYHNAKHDIPCLYVSLEENTDQLARAMSKLEMNVTGDMKLFTVDLGKIRLGHQEDELRKDWLTVLKQFIKKRVDEDGIEIVVVDSMGALYSLTEFKNPRQELFHFFRFLKEVDATVFLISEMEWGSPSYTRYGEDFLADGIIHLLLKEIGETDVQLRIRTVKMRMANHNRSYFTLVHMGDKFQITSVITSD